MACPATAEQAYRATYDSNRHMTAYTDLKTGITLRISNDRHRITAVDPKGNQLWSRADYFEPNIKELGGQARAAIPVTIWT